MAAPEETIAEPGDMGSYRPVTNLPFLGKVIERSAALQFFLDDIDFLDPFQPVFRPEFRMETALAALVES